jgi:hypothetical protein
MDRRKAISYFTNIPRKWYLPNIGSNQELIMDIMVVEHVHLPSFWEVNHVLFWNTIDIFWNASHKMVISFFTFMQSMKTISFQF